MQTENFNEVQDSEIAQSYTFNQFTVTSNGYRGTNLAIYKPEELGEDLGAQVIGPDRGGEPDGQHHQQGFQQLHHRHGYVLSGCWNNRPKVGIAGSPRGLPANAYAPRPAMGAVQPF